MDLRDDDEIDDDADVLEYAAQEVAGLHTVDPWPEAIALVQLKWKCTARRFSPTMGGIYAMHREVKGPQTKPVVVSFVELIEAGVSWREVVRSGVIVSHRVWNLCRALCQIAGLPFIILVAATDGVYFLKVGDFGPPGTHDHNLAAHGFRQVV